MKKQPKSRKITGQEANDLIDRWDKHQLRPEDYDKFYCREKDGTVTAIDNSDGNCWTEDFSNMFAAMKWLHEFKEKIQNNE